MATLNIKNFPEELYNSLGQKAKNDQRSLTGEVIYLLKWALQATSEEKQSIRRLRGLGKKLWKDVDASKHVDKERESWE